MEEISKTPIYNIKVKVYGKSLNTANSHSYLVDDVPTGISSCIGELNINIKTTSLLELRPMIQYDRSGHMDKRSVMFQEALFIMGRLPNYYTRPTKELNKYQFGFLNKNGLDLKIINVNDETKPICELLGTIDFFDYYLLLVPLSQIPP
jgi:hypothetical protein